MRFMNKKQTEVRNNIVSDRRRILSERSSFAVTEAYRTLRANIHFYLRGEGCKKFCITSGTAGEGKSTTILNLAISFAQTEKKVLLIDADLRRPMIAQLLAQKAEPGLSDVLRGLADDNAAIHSQVFPNLDIMFSGEIPPNPSELLQSDKMLQLLERLGHRYDYILLNTPPVGVVADACLVANCLDGVLFLVRKNGVERDVVQKGIKQLEFAGANVMGFVLNSPEEENEQKYYRRSGYCRFLSSKQPGGGKYD